MDPAFAKGVMLLASITMVVIRAPYGQQSQKVAVAKSHKGILETALLTLAWLAFFLPLMWIVTPVFAFADYPLHPLAFVVGTACFIGGLWLFHRSHRDLGANWSITLEVREQHQLVTAGVYHRVRHPMYLALLIYGTGQALVVPNYLAGTSYGVAMLLVFMLRLGPEEQMMREEFGAEYEAYRARSKRLVPGIW